MPVDFSRQLLPLVARRRETKPSLPPVVPRKFVKMAAFDQETNKKDPTDARVRKEVYRMVEDSEALQEYLEQVDSVLDSKVAAIRWPANGGGSEAGTALLMEQIAAEVRCTLIILFTVLLCSFYRLRILHRDVSASNVIVTSDGSGVLIDYDTAVFMDGPEGEAERKKNAGTLAFRARELVEEYKGRPAFFHEPWHDIDSLVYVIMYTVFIIPSGPDDSSELSEDVKSIWRQWSSQLGAVNSGDELFLAPWGAKQWFEPFKEFWKEDLRALVQMIAKYCGLGVQRSSWAAEVDEAAVLEPLWASGEFSHGLLASDLDALIERIVEGTARDRAPSKVQGGDRRRSDLVA